MNPPITRIGFIFKRNDSRVPRILASLLPWIESRQMQYFLETETAAEHSIEAPTRSEQELAESCDVVAVFGGDGTLLAAARLMAGRGTPILGVNMGSLGFLTDVKLDEMLDAFGALASGEYSLEQRILLQVEVERNGSFLARYLALNDAVINKGALARIIELEVRVSEELVAFFRSDGLIVATPTGSTAYSMSAGGPIIYPTLEAFIINPICPHTLTNRPVVVPDSGSIEVVLHLGSDVMLTVDGQVGMPLQPGDMLRIRKAQPVIRLVQASGASFFKVLREKLKWG